MIPDRNLGRRTFLAAAASASGALFGGGIPAAKAETGASGLTAERLTWAGLKLEWGPVALFIDAVNPDPPGRPGPALQTRAARSFALVTHHHPDHCDPAALASVLGRSGYLVAHEAVLDMFDHRSVNVQPARTFEPVFLSRGGGEFVAWCVPAADGLGSPQFSWVIDGGGKRVIHCGDTAWHSGWWDIGRAYGPFDAAFLPINGFRQTGGRFREAPEAMSLTPEQAAHAAKLLRAEVAVPIHFGAPPDPDYVEEPNALARFIRAAAAQSVRVRSLAPGESMAL